MVLTDLKISFIPSFPRPIFTGVSQVSQVSLEISPVFGISLFFSGLIPASDQALNTREMGLRVV